MHNNPWLSSTFIIYFALAVHYIKTHTHTQIIWRDGSGEITLLFWSLITFNIPEVPRSSILQSWALWKFTPRKQVRRKEGVKTWWEEEERKERMKITLFWNKDQSHLFIPLWNLVRLLGHTYIRKIGNFKIKLLTQ